MSTPKLISLFVAGLVAFAPFSLQAEEMRRLMVTGEASMDVAPDQAVITLGVRSQSEEAGEAMSQVSVSMGEVLARLQDSGIGAGDIQTRQVSMHPVWSQVRQGGQEVRAITGFEASNLVEVTLRDLEAMGGVLDDVLRAGANEFRGLAFSYSDTKAAQDKLRTEAVEDAIRKARQLADASGMTLGPVRMLQDGEPTGGAPMMAMEMARSADIQVAPGSVNLSHRVSATFDLLEPSTPD
ncbi:SIMPL domain-containing protein [Phaeobacter sp. B1627]|uniref:SIMPL domain-containing protein n=1 Tax=Phaeobacter sp. B1627 TaxID=2583809 RepID=UPI00111B0C68|nr:SIMPL domain-containing protein [Phaeobacter sp. B1627]TNJ41759.1 DUF541 domain-containing protein [Phaeobacter sp. B1627]